MSHSFLMEPGRWNIDGFWLERQQEPIPIKGRTLVVWNQEDWFTMVTKLVFSDPRRDDISFQYRGRLNEAERHYTYVLQHSQFGKVEGEGWISDRAIIQRYWVLGDQHRQSGFETFYQLNPTCYHFAGGILTGHYLTSTMDATLEKQV